MSRRDFSTRARSAMSGNSLADDVALALAILALGVAVRGAWGAWDAWEAAAGGLQQTQSQQATQQQRVEEMERRSGPPDQLVAQAIQTAEAPPARVLAAVAALLPPDVRLESFDVSYTGTVMVEVRVAARQPASYDAFLQRLAASPLFADVAPGEEVRAADVRTVVRARFVGGGA